MQGPGLGLPLIERAGHRNCGGRGMGEFKANGHGLRAGDVAMVMAATVVMVVFHMREFVSFLGQSSFAEHLGGDKNEPGPPKTPSKEKIYQGVTDGGKHGNDHQCYHKWKIG